MPKLLSHKKKIIIISSSIVLGLLGGYGLTLLDKRLSALEFFVLILGIFALLSIIEVISIARSEKHRAKHISGSTSDLIGKRGIVLNDCAPEGTVKIGQEIWKALTENGSTLKKGKEVIVRKRQGLILLIDAFNEESFASNKALERDA